MWPTLSNGVLTTSRLYDEFYVLTDCTSACPSDHARNSDCTYCTCLSPTNITFKVLDQTGVPLEDVIVHVTGLPSAVLGLTGIDGRITISDQCDSSYVAITKDGFMTNTVALNAATPHVTLTRIGNK